MPSIPREIEYTADYERELCFAVGVVASRYIHADPLSIIKEYVMGGPRLYHNNAIDPSAMFYITIEFNGAQILCTDAKGQDVKTDGASLEDIYSLAFFPLAREIVGNDTIEIVERKNGKKHDYVLINHDNDGFIVTANGTVVQRNSVHLTEFLSAIAPRFAYKAKTISISSVSSSFAARKWIEIIGGHGYMHYPTRFVSTRIPGEVRVIREYSFNNFIQSYWRQRETDYKCTLKEDCNCHACTDDDHKWCKERNKKCPFI